MPSSPNYKRNYKEEYRNYDGTTAVKKKRAKRNKARRIMEREGRVRKGDGKDVDHKRPLSKGGSSSRSNLRVTSARSNRSYKRTSSGKMK
jgi:5-methylcytosine-specific restriction endonuclease McrA